MMVESQAVKQHFYQVYTFEIVADLPAPKKGQLVMVNKTPDFGDDSILLITDGRHTIRELYEIHVANNSLAQLIRHQADLSAHGATYSAIPGHIAKRNDRCTFEIGQPMRPNEPVRKVDLDEKSEIIDQMSNEISRLHFIIEYLDQFIKDRLGPFTDAVLLITEDGLFLGTENDDQIVVMA
jgi:hypothetical protein